MASRKKRKIITIEDKIEIIKKVDSKQLTLQQIAVEFGLADHSSVSKIMKNREKILSADLPRNSKSLKISMHPNLDEMIFEWFCNLRSNNLPITGSIIQEKAAQFAVRLGYEDFKASDGWLNRFKNRHNIKEKPICGEGASVSMAYIQNERGCLEREVKKLQPSRYLQL